MERNQYHEEVARVICELTGMDETLEVRVNGVYVKPEYADHDPTDVLAWSPTWEADWGESAADPLRDPWLPVPFTAEELAAFMLDGIGYLIQERFGSIANRPDEVELGKLRPKYWRVGKALREAYAMAQQAQRVVGPEPREAAQLADKLAGQYDDANELANTREGVFEPGISRKDAQELRARAKASNAALWTQLQQAQSDADAQRKAWRRAMVAQLIGPARITNSPGLAPPSRTPAGETAGGPAKRATRGSWKDAAWPYVVDALRAGQFSSAKQLFNALEQRARTNEGPFEIGTGTLRGSLFVRSTGRTLALKTLQTAWKDLSAEARR